MRARADRRVRLGAQALRRGGALLLALLCAVLAGRAAQAADAAPPQVTAAMPAEFAALAATQRIVVDVYVADRRIGQYAAEVGLAEVRLLDPAAVAAAIPDLLDRALVAAALTSPLAVGAHPRCDDTSGCVAAARARVAASYDRAAFRLTLALDPRLLAVRGEEARYLEDADTAPSAVDTIGVAIAGGGGLNASYAIRNRLVAGRGAVHLLSDTSLSSWDGGRLDTLAAEVDRRDLRLRGGLFYAPGPDLVGRRRILGVGVATQFDTRADRVALSGTPLVVFLPQRARVDVYVQGRLVSSQSYESGNQALDTSGLADGSYPIELRIQEAGGATRVEQRFFTKSAALAPAGRIVFDAQVGVLTRDREDRDGERIAIATGRARGRIGTHLAWDAAAMVTRDNAVVEGGLALFTATAQARVALLGARRGDRGVAAQLSSSGGSALSYSLDVRHVRSADGTPLIAADDAARDIAPLTRARDERAGSSYTQMLGSLSYSLPRAQLGLTGYLFRTAARRASYSVGPSARWSVLQRDRLQLSLTGQYARTQRGAAVAFGIQLQLLGQRAALSTALGVQRGASGDARGLAPALETAASLHRDDALGGAVDAGALVQRGAAGTIVQLSGEHRSALGLAALNLTGRTGAMGSALQYGLTGQTSFAVTRRGLGLGAEGQNDSLIAVTVGGDPQARFELLVDDAVRGTLHGGQRLTLAVQPYRRYKVRLRAIATDLIAFDTRARTIDVFPGSVAALDWEVRSVRAMFGRLVDRAGAPIADADLSAEDSIGATDSNGYFQIQAGAGARLTARTGAGLACTARLAAAVPATTYTRLGDVTCHP
ncbi:TcfC E-set like domain-containing protein [Sphingomonas yunnanensis]|uniref:TcfC E-set like domain-containing protein n=1 Tax=Sphingomonas yunnanensis TaxID=310400 RepID=UPI001CA63125|nr:TcfC E-set like domain-containing protein [Sphingomonas yunnanensis]MBY9063531.1 TcfC E-set like domain-containing protein [Sphingomonas yunnanensis]